MSITNYCTVEVIELNKSFTDNALSMNTANRPVSGTYVKRYANDMRNGLWKFNGEPIIFSSDGRLIQGQHRLIAHKEAGYLTGIKTLVVRLLNDENNSAFRTLDCGLKRSYGQVLQMDGVKNYKSIAAIRRCICECFRGLGRSPSVCEMGKVGEDYADVVNALYASGINFANLSTDSYKTGCVVCAKAIKDVDFVVKFLKRVQIGANLQEKSPELALKNFMISYRVKGGNGVIGQISAMCKCIISSFNGACMSYVRPSADGIEMVKKVAAKNGVTL